MPAVTYVKMVPPELLPTTLQGGQLTTLTENPYILHGEARLVGDLYYGKWIRSEGKSSTFVAARLVDWGQWRSEREAADGLLAKDLVEEQLDPSLDELRRLNDEIEGQYALLPGSSPEAAASVEARIAAMDKRAAEIIRRRADAVLVPMAAEFDALEKRSRQLLGDARAPKAAADANDAGKPLGKALW